MTVETKNLGGAFMESSQTGANTKYNENLALFDGFITCLLLDRGVNTPVVDPDDGDMYLLGSSPTGVWAGHGDEIAWALNSAWKFVDPAAGDGLPILAFVNDEKLWIAYNPVEDLWHPMQRYHSTSEEFTGRYDRNGSKIYCKTIDLGALPNSTSSTDAHGITSLDLGKRILIEGWAEDGGTNVYPIPCSIGANRIEVKIDSTNVTITTNFDGSTYTGEVYLEYCKS